MMPALKAYRMTCETCGFVTHDEPLMERHSCDVTAHRGFCEDYPACGHEHGDCNGLLYGSDESIKEEVERLWATGHGMCDHAEGIYNCDEYGEEDGDDDDDV